MTVLALDPHYLQLLTQLKERIRSAQLRAALAVNQELIQLYWYIGKQLLEKQEQTRWGSKFLESLSRDLQNAFPETQGFSVPNLKRMRLLAKQYPTLEIGSQLVSQLPWGHLSVLLHQVKATKARDWYAQQALHQGWSRYTLEDAIKSNVYQRQTPSERKVSNYLTRLPAPQSQLAHDMLKSPYNFDFLGLHDKAHERAIEYAATQHITKFLLELGRGFSFIGTQVPIVIDEHEFFIDMLFYHVKLHCYVVIELKATAFKPEHAGQLNFYLTAVDRTLKTSEDHPSIGLLLCKSRSKVIAEYALHGINKPIGVSEYQLSKIVPDNLKTDLPSIEEIEHELNAQPKGLDTSKAKADKD